MTNKNKDKNIELSVRDFVDLGFLQEVNRYVLHPCGLALSVAVDENNEYSLGPIWDCRNDPEGILFGSDIVELQDFEEKMKKVHDEFVKHMKARQELVGHVFQTPKNML